MKATAIGLIRVEMSIDDAIIIRELVSTHMPVHSPNAQVAEEFIKAIHIGLNALVTVADR